MGSLVLTFYAAIAVLIFEIVSGAPEPTKRTRPKTSRLMPIASAQSIAVWKLLQYFLSAACSSLVSGSLFRFLVVAVCICITFVLMK